jgi:hypothetical protein
MKPTVRMEYDSISKEYRYAFPFDMKNETGTYLFKLRKWYNPIRWFTGKYFLDGPIEGPSDVEKLIQFPKIGVKE